MLWANTWTTLKVTKCTPHVQLPTGGKACRKDVILIEDTYPNEDILKMPGPSSLQMKIQCSSNDLEKGSMTGVLLIQGTFLEAEGAQWELELSK